MSKIKNKNLINYIKLHFIYLGLAIICVIILFGLQLSKNRYSLDEYNSNNVEDLEIVLDRNQYTEEAIEKSVFLESSFMPVLIEDKGENGYYLIHEDHFYYILYTSNDHIDQIRKNYMYSGDAHSPSESRIPERYTGQTKKISKKVKETIIKKYNEKSGNRTINLDNYSRYFSEVLLVSTKAHKDTTIKEIQLLVLFFTILFGGGFIIEICAISWFLSRMQPEVLEKINGAETDSDYKYFKHIFVHVLKDGIFKCELGFNFIDYDDIIGAYETPFQYGRYIYFYNKLGKCYTSFYLFSKGKKECAELFEILKEKNPNIVIGNDKETKKWIEQKSLELRRQNR